MANTDSAMQQVWKTYGVSALWKFKLVDIKDELRIKGLLLTGNKPDVIERLNRKYLSELTEEEAIQHAKTTSETALDNGDEEEKEEEEDHQSPTITTQVKTDDVTKVSPIAQTLVQPPPLPIPPTLTTPLLAPNMYNPYVPGVLPMWSTVSPLQPNTQGPIVPPPPLPSSINNGQKSTSPITAPIKKTPPPTLQHNHYHNHMHYNQNMYNTYVLPNSMMPIIGYNGYVPMPQYYPTIASAPAKPLLKPNNTSQLKVISPPMSHASSPMSVTPTMSPDKSVIDADPSKTSPPQVAPPSPTRYHNPPSKLKKMGLMKEPILAAKTVYGSKVKSQALLVEKKASSSITSSQANVNTPTVIQPTGLTKTGKVPKRYQHSAAWLNKKEQERAAAAAREAASGSKPIKQKQSKKIKLLDPPMMTNQKDKKHEKKKSEPSPSQSVKRETIEIKPIITDRVGHKGPPKSTPLKMPTKKKRKIDQEVKQESSDASSDTSALIMQIDNVFKGEPLQMIHEGDDLADYMSDLYTDFASSTPTDLTSTTSSSSLNGLMVDLTSCLNVKQEDQSSRAISDNNAEEDEAFLTAPDENQSQCDYEYHFSVHLIRDSQSDSRQIRIHGNTSLHDLIHATLDTFQEDHFGGLGIVAGVDHESRYTVSLPTGELLYHPNHVPQELNCASSSDQVTLYSGGINLEHVVRVVFEDQDATLTLNVEAITQVQDEEEATMDYSQEDGIHVYFNHHDDELDSQGETLGAVENVTMIESV
ncbi:hypothetical protein AKO1_002537 [Acrasis kona]|uniref:SAP domain-containing protein n=1 Tax=Acrasis kona TaxID=1008807 RepID=A0AAW2ZP74_9EUKA